MSARRNRTITMLLGRAAMALLWSAGALGAQAAVPARHAHPPAAGFEDYTAPVGRMEGGVLRIRLDAGTAVWRPWRDGGPALLAYVFAADGAPPRVPAPLIRVRAGTPVHATVRNGFAHPLVVRGLHDHVPPPPEQRRPGLPPGDSVVIAPGATAELRFAPTVPGTFVFRGSLRGQVEEPEGVLHSEAGADRSFVGVMIVDPAEPAPPAGERVFLITHWADPGRPASYLPATRFFINGRSWPHTERLHAAEGDTVRWRVVNFSGRPHPMHLHGFYFHVDARGDLVEERVFAPEERRLVVTEVLAPAKSMRVSWVADEPGNWVFHCHLMRHMSRVQHAPLTPDPAAHPAAPDGELMGGLVLGITVRPHPDRAESARPARRRLDLHVTRRPGVFGAAPGYGFVLQEDARPPAADSLRFPGSLIELRRGEPAKIVVHNRADVPLGVHWHGLELESRGDGVPGWSGAPGATVPAVAPGDSLAVRITPRRAGTFMYHVHSEPGHQLAQGLYGPFLVTEPDRPRDPASDLYFLLGSLGDGDDPPPAINGRAQPEPVELRAGRAYRLRFMHISPDDEKHVSLLVDGQPVEWRWIAKDGADLPAAQRRDRPARQRMDVGETYDFLWTPEAAGEFTLRVETKFDAGAPLFPRPAPSPHAAEVRIRVLPDGRASGVTEPAPRSADRPPPPAPLR